MYEVAVRDLPARSLLSLLRRVRAEELVPVGRAFVSRFRDGAVPVPRLDGIAGAPFLIYHGEVGPDGDGPIE